MLDDLQIADMAKSFEIIVPWYFPGFERAVWEENPCTEPNLIDSAGGHYRNESIYAFQQSIHDILTTLWKSPRILEIAKWHYLLDFLRFEANKYVGEITPAILNKEGGIMISRYLRVFTSHPYWDGMKIAVIIDKKGSSKFFKTVFREKFTDERFEYSYFPIPDEVIAEMDLRQGENIKSYVKVDKSEVFPYESFHRMKDDISRLFKKYEKSYKDLDVGKSSEVFAENIISAGPKGAAMIGKKELIDETNRMIRLLKKAGWISAGIRTIEEFPLDQKYSLVSVVWQDSFEKEPEKTIPFTVSYIVEKRGEPCILMLFAHQEKQERMKNLDLI